MDAVMGVFAALGLSTAAGLNAYIPILTVGLLARFTDLVTLPAPWDRLEDPVVLGVVAAIAICDFVGDKIPVIDHVLHAIGVVVAPVVGGLLALGTANVVDIDPGFVVLLGVAASLATHLTRTAARPISTAVTGGLGNPVLSLGEDGSSAVLSVAAVVAPLLAAVLAVIVLVLVVVLWRRAVAARPGRGSPAP
jgi:hypothetical protein